MLDLPENVDNYDYGLKSALTQLEEDEERNDDETTESDKENEDVVEKEVVQDKKSDIDLPPDAFLMVTQVCNHSF